jgi:hypothetical protein
MLPPRFFHEFFRRTLKSGRVSIMYRADCDECAEKARRAAGIPVRHQRRNARGDYWCNHCKRYRPADCFADHPTPSRTGTKWSYCRDCVRELDRLRYHASVSTPEGRAKVQAARAQRQRRRKRAEYAERRETVANAIDVLHWRGLTDMDISEILDVSFASVWHWKQKKRRVVTEAVVERMLALVTATKEWPKLDQPAYRRRTPHPKRDELRERLRPLLLQFPVRSRWVNGRRAA